MNLVIFILLCFIWGTTWIAIKISLEALPPFIGSGARFFTALVVLLMIIVIKKVPFRVSPKKISILLVTGLLMYVFDYGLVYWGEQYLSAGVTAIFFATFSLFTALWSNFFFKNERFNWNIFMGLLVGFLGIVLVFFDQLMALDFKITAVFAAGAIISGAACGAMSVVIVKKYLIDIHPLILTFYQMLVGACALLSIGFAFEITVLNQLTLRVILSVLYLGIVGSATAFVLYYWLLKRMSAITLSLIIYVTPLVALVLDYIFFNEVIAWPSFLGMAIVFGGIWLSQKKSNRLE